MSKTTEVAAEPLVSIDETLEYLAEQQSKVARLSSQMSQGVVNPIVLAKVCGIKPQQVYNYIRKGYIAAVRENNTQKLYIELNDAVAFVMRRLNRSAAEQLRINEELEAVAS